MKLKLLSLSLALALPACSGPAHKPAEPAPVALPAPAPAPAPAAAPARAKTAYGTWGFDLAGMDRSAAPGNDFFRYANGTWADTTQIPADKSAYALFTKLYEDSQVQTRAIVEAVAGAPGSEEQKIADYYKTFMDEAAIEALGLKPLQPMLGKIAKIADVRGVVLQLADNSRHGITSPFNAIVGQDDRQPDQYIGAIYQGGLGLPDRDMYDLKNAQFEPLRAGYKHYIEQMFTLAGLKNAAPRAAAVYALEDKLAATHWTQIQNRDPVKTYNKLSIAELQKAAPAVDWKPWLKAVGFDSLGHVLVAEPSAITGMAKLVASQPVAVWRDYLTLHQLGAAAPYLSKAFVDARFELYGKTLGGTPELAARWKRGVDNTADVLGEAIGKIYVAKHFTPETKAAADRLVQNLLTAMGQRLDGLTWMSDATKAKAKEKLATYNPKIGYPKKWRDYSALQVTAGDAVGNAWHAAEFWWNRQLKKLGQPVDRDEWGMTPMEVNAYYNPVLNEIVFPAAILQPPFFDPNADDAVNYGSIGAVIGHEIS
ncbi:MAG TPA: M13 family metallopeptidase, partial [Kofleriaceae bacterium]